MRCLVRCTLALFALGAILAGLAAVAGRDASAWLARPDPLDRADAIVVLGQDPTRAFEAADLYRAGLAPRVLLSRPKREARLLYLESQGIGVPWFEVAARTILRGRGVPEEAIGTFGDKLISTLTEAQAVAAALPGARRLIVVTSPYHARRARLIFRDLLPGADVRLAENHYETLPRAWWADETSANNVIMEFLKLAFYEAGGQMSPVD
jgi:uncharacterized SAM-binding protein YcdF (DUF218 family)